MKGSQLIGLFSFMMTIAESPFLMNFSSSPVALTSSSVNLGMNFMELADNLEVGGILSDFSVRLFGWFNIIKSFNNDETFVPWGVGGSF